MGKVALSDPIQVGERVMREIDIRPPGAGAYGAMSRARSAKGFGRDAQIRFAARLSGHAEMTLRRLTEHDLDAIGREIENQYWAACRRFARRNALAEGSGHLKPARPSETWNQP